MATEYSSSALAARDLPAADPYLPESAQEVRLAPCRSIPVTAEMRERDERERARRAAAVGGSGWTLGEEIRALPEEERCRRWGVQPRATQKACRWCGVRMTREERVAHGPICPRRPHPSPETGLRPQRLDHNVTCQHCGKLYRQSARAEHRAACREWPARKERVRIQRPCRHCGALFFTKACRQHEPRCPQKPHVFRHGPLPKVFRDCPHCGERMGAKAPGRTHSPLPAEAADALRGSQAGAAAVSALWRGDGV